MRMWLESIFQCSALLKMCSRYNGESRGLGFVTFKEPQMLDEALKERHEFLGQEVNLERQDRRPRFGGGDDRGRGGFGRGGGGFGGGGSKRLGMGSMSRDSRFFSIEKTGTLDIAFACFRVQLV